MKPMADAPLAQTFRSAECMPLDLPLRCRCGRMRGVASDVSPSTGFRFVCYCKDCQAFARFLERADVLDPAGGTDIFQMPPARVKLTAGTDALRCLRLSRQASSAGTPIAAGPRSATPPPRPRFPVVGADSFLHGPRGRRPFPRRGARPAALPHLRTLRHRAAPAERARPPSLGVFARRASKMLGWWLRGLGRPTPFFDDRTKAPRAVPRVLTRSERAASLTPPSRIGRYSSVVGNNVRNWQLMMWWTAPAPGSEFP